MASAILFGLSAPTAKLLLPGASPWLLAGLLYLGAGLGLTLVRLITQTRTATATDRLQRKDLSRLAAIVLAGGAVGPVLLLIGLTRVSGVVGSLLLNLEAVLTMAIAVLIYRERLKRLEAIGALFVVAGRSSSVIGPIRGEPTSWGSWRLPAPAWPGRWTTTSRAKSRSATRYNSFR